MHNLRDQQHWHRSLWALPEIAGHLREILERFLVVVRCVDAATLDDGMLEALPLPSQVGRSRVAGIDVNRPRMVAVLQAVVMLSSRPGGLVSRDGGPSSGSDGSERGGVRSTTGVVRPEEAAGQGVGGACAEVAALRGHGVGSSDDGRGGNRA